MDIPYLCDVLKFNDVLWQNNLMIKHKPFTLSEATVTIFVFHRTCFRS